jgi:hypothetical protein
MKNQSGGKGARKASVLGRVNGCCYDTAEKAAWRGSACDQAEGAGGCAKRPASCADLPHIIFAEAGTLFALCNSYQRSAHAGEVPADRVDLTTEVVVVASRMTV